VGPALSGLGFFTIFKGLLRVSLRANHSFVGFSPPFGDGFISLLTADPLVPRENPPDFIVGDVSYSLLHCLCLFTFLVVPLPYFFYQGQPRPHWFFSDRAPLPSSNFLNPPGDKPDPPQRQSHTLRVIALHSILSPPLHVPRDICTWIFCPSSGRSSLSFPLLFFLDLSFFHSV